MTTVPSGVLFVGGEGPPTEIARPFVEQARFVIAADSGYDLALRLGYRPDVLVGDMDSIEDLAEAERAMGTQIRRFAREKDETDAEIGLRLLHEMGALSVTILGGGGGRLDHLVGILTLFERARPPKRWITANDEVVSIDGTEVFQRMRGAVCSFFPVGDGPVTMESSGLRWPLAGLEWKHGDAGISNYGTAETVSVATHTGRLIMIRSLRERSDG